jgi:hypothetical protein
MRFSQPGTGIFRWRAHCLHPGGGAVDEAAPVVHTGPMDDERRKQLLQRRDELLNNPTGLDAAETRRLDAEDRVTMCVRANNTPGFPMPLPTEVEAAERDLAEATQECDRIHEELRNIDQDLGML